MSENQTPATETPETEGTKHSGRQMSFTVLEDGRIQAAFGEGIDPLFLSPSEVPEQIQLAAITEGLISRARSYTSKLIGAEARTGAALREVIGKAFDNLRAGSWKVERVAAEGSYTIEVRAALLFRQMRAAAKGEECTDTLAQVADNWAALTDEQKKGVKALSRYQQALAQIKAADAAEKARKLAEKADAEDDGTF